MSRPLFTGAQVAALRVLLGKSGLAQPSGWLPFAVYEMHPFNQGTDGAPYNATISRPFTIRHWAQGLHVATTNDGSNYWKLELRKADATVIHTLDSSAMSAGTTTLLRGSGINYAVATSVVGLYVQIYKVGSPGNYYAYAPAVFVT